MVEQQTFRDAMARLGAAVNVITSDGEAGPLGFTASAVCSVSDSPPTVLVCMNRNSQQNGPLKRNGVFCVNSLAADQQEVSNVFAGRGGLSIPERFGKYDWSTLATGSPALNGALISFDCRIVDTIEVATHTILIGEVLAIRSSAADASALMYFDRRYHALGADSAAQPCGASR